MAASSRPQTERPAGSGEAPAFPAPRFTRSWPIRPCRAASSPEQPPAFSNRETAHAAEGLEASGHGGGQPEVGEARPGGNRESRGPHAVGGQPRSRSAEEGEALDRASGGGVSRDVPRRRKVLALRSRD